MKSDQGKISHKKHIREAVRSAADRILGMRLIYRMLLLYIAGGLLPMVLIGVYLIFGTRHILIEQAKNEEHTELELVSDQILGNLNTVSNVSKMFYFDEKLEKLAFYPYEEYQEVVDDFRAYTAFQEYENHYAQIIEWISIYLNNETLPGNAHFVRVDPEIAGEAWYRTAVARGGAGAWQYMPFVLDDHHCLALTRLLKTRKGEDVGVLAVLVREESMLGLIQNRRADTRILLNGRQQVTSNSDQISLEAFREFLPEQQGNSYYQQKVKISGEEYVLTSVQKLLANSEDTMQLVSLKAYGDILEKADRQSRKSVLIFAGSVLLSVILIWLFSKSFSDRVNRFSRQMHRAAEGRFDLEPSLGGQDEISELYGYLSTMIWKIQKLLAEIYQERLQAERLESRQREAEFKMLASQINPHFLYNTLETIRMKARVNGQREIEELTKMLAKLLRRNIQAGSQDVSLQTEVELAEYYLKIQQYRFGDRIQYEISMEPGLEQCQILPLVIQPIVENSIIHGLETKVGIGKIHIQAERREDGIWVLVEDNGRGMSAERLEEICRDLNSRKLDRTHIGISNVHQRLKLKYGERYGLTVASEENVMTRVELHIPDTDAGGEVN